MSEAIDNVARELAAIADEAKASFGSLSALQLNWKPAEKSWSIAQCFDHLITTHGLYLPLLKKIVSDGYQPTLWERTSPFSGMLGRFLIKSMRPENAKKMKTTAKAEPSKSEIDADIIERFADHQRELIEHIQRLPASIDPAKAIITSPLLGVVTYSLEDTFTILTVHCQRHLGQAKRVMEAEGFPV